MARILVVFVLLAAVCCLPACSTPEPEEATVIRPVRYVRVYSDATGSTREFSGTARAGVESRLSFKVVGTIEELPVQMGDEVEAGQLLARLDSKDYELRVDQTTASLEQALAQERNAQADYRRVSALYENDNASRDQLDAARAGMESATAQVRSLTNSLELARLQLEYTELRSPTAGSILSVGVERDENVGQGEVVATLSGDSAPEVVVGVPELLISRIRVGDAVTVRFDALGDRQFAANVSEVALAARGATYEVSARILAPDEAMRPGMACQVGFEFEASGDAGQIVLPPVAVGEDRDGQFVYVVEDLDGEQGVTRRRGVEVGALDSRGLRIRSGLSDGEIVVTAGVTKIHDGLTVKLLAN